MCTTYTSMIVIAAFSNTLRIIHGVLARRKNSLSSAGSVRSRTTSKTPERFTAPARSPALSAACLIVLASAAALMFSKKYLYSTFWKTIGRSAPSIDGSSFVSDTSLNTASADVSCSLQKPSSRRSTSSSQSRWSAVHDSSCSPPRSWPANSAQFASTNSETSPSNASVVQNSQKATTSGEISWPVLSRRA